MTIQPDRDRPGNQPERFGPHPNHPARPGGDHFHVERPVTGHPPVADPEVAGRLADQLQTLGVNTHDTRRVARAVAANERLIERLYKTLVARRAEIVDLVDDEAWRYLLNRDIAARRDMLRRLRLPYAGTKIGRHLLKEAVARLRAGVHTGDEATGFSVAHDLTGEVRARLLCCARQGASFPNTGPLGSTIRACAVALCPSDTAFFLPIVLTWMRRHDPVAFQLLLPEPHDQEPLDAFFDEVNDETPAATDDVRGGPSIEAPANEPRDVADVAHRAMDAAVLTCQSTLAELRRGHPPTGEAIAALGFACDAVAEAAAVLSARLATPVAETLAAIDEAARRLTRAVGDAETLRHLLGAQAPDYAVAALSEATALAKTLLDRWPPSSAGDQANTAILVALAELARATTSETVDDADVYLRHERLWVTAPSTMRPLLGAAFRGLVRLSAPKDPKAGGTAGPPVAPPSGPVPMPRSADLGSEPRPADPVPQSRSANPVPEPKPGGPVSKHRPEPSRRDTAGKLGDQLDSLLATYTGLASRDANRVRRRISQGLFELASDDIATLSSGEPLFDTVEDNELGAFFPDGVTALGDGIGPELLAAILDGHRPSKPRSPSVDILPPTISSLPPAIRSELHAGLKGWHILRSVPNWNREYVSDHLLPALRLVGLDARKAAVDHLDRKPFTYARGRRFLDVTGVNVTGEALVPAFGSAARGRYRLLLVWNCPTVEQLDQWRESDGSHLPLIICYFGALPAADRLELARRWSDPTRRAIIVVDDAVLTWVATRRGNFDMVMRLTLPFTSLQPFVRDKLPDVPREMFYGRARERRDLERPNGPSVVYGGRGLGKSALLRTIMTDAEAALNDDFVVVWFEVDQVAGIEDDPVLLWGELAERLEFKGVTPGPRVGRANPESRVTKAVREWTRQPGRRLLILLDEAEGFFNGDAPQFAHVRRLHQLSADSEFACKVVFSGLHSVQHYHQAGNIPFSGAGHLQIGPLTPEPAYQLLARPLAALGYRLDEDEAQRILLHCNYQPYLIQLVAHKLLALRFDARAGGEPLTAPPWVVPSAAVDAALADPQTRRDVRAAFGLTLDLDQRTRMITSVLAIHAYDNQPGARMPDLELYKACQAAWPVGFAETTLFAFRELLDELGGLGILAEDTEDGSGRAIRNETVLHALGGRQDAERYLREAPLAALPVREARGQIRRVRADGVRRGPMTTAQLGQVFRKGNIVRLIVGTTATGVDDVPAVLSEAAPSLVSVKMTDTTAAFKGTLETGVTDVRRLLVVSDLRERTKIDACEIALTLALGDCSSGAGLPKNRAASRTVVLVAGTGNVEWLADIAERSYAEDIVMPLERYTGYTLPLRWRGESGPSGLDGLADGALARDMLAVTDGWPTLVEWFAAEVGGGAGRPDSTPGAVLKRLRDLRSDEQWCRRFLVSAGADLPSWPDMARLVEVLVEYDTPCVLKDVSLLAADKVERLEPTVRLARWFGLVTLTADEELTLSSLVATCWRTAKMTAG